MPHPVTEWRERAGFSQEELAARARVSQSTVQRIEKYNGCNTDVAQRIADLAAGQLTLSDFISKRLRISRARRRAA